MHLSYVGNTDSGGSLVSQEAILLAISTHSSKIGLKTLLLLFVSLCYFLCKKQERK
jgi:hypothetical protein